MLRVEDVIRDATTNQSNDSITIERLSYVSSTLAAELCPSSEVLLALLSPDALHAVGRRLLQRAMVIRAILEVASERLAPERQHWMGLFAELSVREVEVIGLVASGQIDIITASAL